MVDKINEKINPSEKDKVDQAIQDACRAIISVLTDESKDIEAIVFSCKFKDIDPSDSEELITEEILAGRMSMLKALTVVLFEKIE